MKRDMDLVRTILLIAENHEQEYLEQTDVRCGLDRQFPEEKWTDEQLVAHVGMMQEARLVEARFLRFTDARDTFAFLRLTQEGQEFIAAARDSKVWETIKSKGGEASLAIFKLLAVEAVKAAVLST